MAAYPTFGGNFSAFRDFIIPLSHTLWILLHAGQNTLNSLSAADLLQTPLTALSIPSQLVIGGWEVGKGRAGREEWKGREGIRNVSIFCRN